MKNKLSVAFLWHMHQPMYRDIITGKYHLPWVRLHATYSYLDMVAVLDDFPESKCTFNLTPSLIWQLQDIAVSDTIDDKYLTLSLKEAENLTDKDKVFLLKNFFSCDYANAIASLPRYKQLFLKRGNNFKEEELLRRTKDFNTRDLRDLQLLFNLAWCGFTLREKDSLIRSLIRKGTEFSEEDKVLFLNRQKEVVGQILPAYKNLQDEGRIEISTTPFYHPILPILCEKGSGFKEDAKVQIQKAVKLYKDVFGGKPLGMWPSEGSVSQDIIPLLADEGIKWMATDEGILLESFKGQSVRRNEFIYKAFTAEEDGRKIDMVFRDINLSNAISFNYSQSSGKKSAKSFLHDIKEIAGYCARGKDERIVSVILDGENPWPYYPGGGKRFLSEMYKGLMSSRDVKLVTIGGYLEEHKERGEIKKLFAGSWIDRSFNKWKGSPQKDRAWEYLEKARREVFLSPEEPNKKVMEALYIAEGSDWFWWYDDFGSELDFVFDELYRKNLSNIYSLIGRNIPYYLKRSIPVTPSVRSIQEGSARVEMGQRMKVLFVTSEAVPFAKTGGLADVSGSLPKALASLGVDVRVIMPFYKITAQGDFEFEKEKHVSGHSLEGGFTIYSNRRDGITTYFIKKKRYFTKKGLYGTDKGDHPDNDQRFAYFSRAVLEAVKAMDFKPDIIHCNDWQSALVPFYLKFKLSHDKFFHNVKTLFTIHNMVYQGIFDKKILHKAGIPEHLFNMENLEFYGRVNFMKAGILYSDAINTVSRRYAGEIMTSECGAGLDGLLRRRKDLLYGIPNGVDYSVWSPKNDMFIKTRFDADSIGKKKECKKDLLEYTRLSLSIDAPLLGSVTRLAEQKGMDLVAEIMGKLVKLGAGVIILGTGTIRYNRMFGKLAKKYPKNVYVCNDFNDELAHKIEAGCDIFLMPSRYEPCGLNQMYSIKYGTIPVVRATGGLDDVIIDHDEDRKNGNGFKFAFASKDDLYNTIERAIYLYEDKEEWNKLVVRAMSYDFSWSRSAKQYLALYRELNGDGGS